jgi:hypothetical protein
MGILDQLNQPKPAGNPAPAAGTPAAPAQATGIATPAAAEATTETEAQWKKSKAKRQRLINALTALAVTVEASTGKVTLTPEQVEAKEFFLNPRSNGAVVASKTVFELLFPNAKVGDKVGFREAFQRTERDALSLLKLAKKWDAKGIEVAYVNKEFILNALPTAKA